nr:hypothetical protein 9 [bacterium]
MDAAEVQRLIPELHALISRFEAAAPGRHFTVDGHLVGSIGEVLAADRFGLKLSIASTKGVDARTADGRRVEVKATMGKRGVALRGSVPEAEFLLAIQVHPDGSFTVIYNGPAAPAWERIAHKKMPDNGQRSITLNQLRELQAKVLPEVG